MTEEEQRPKVGVGVMVLKDGKVLLSFRKSAHGSGYYAGPGGHLEHLESIEACAAREVEEECAIRIQTIRFGFVANITQFAPKHYIHIGMIADWESGEPVATELEKQGDWEWYPLDALPEPLSPIYAYAVQNLKTAETFFDTNHAGSA